MLHFCVEIKMFADDAKLFVEILLMLINCKVHLTLWLHELIDSSLGGRPFTTFTWEGGLTKVDGCVWGWGDQKA